MNERIQRYLDGELSWEALTSEERHEVGLYEETLEESCAVISQEPVPDVTGTVMERIAREAAVPSSAEQVPGPVRALGRIAAWLWSPRPIRVRPAYGLAGAAGLAALAILLPGPDSAPVPTAPVAEAPAEEEAQVFVQFRLDEPDASTVELAGSFTEWEADYALHQTGPGMWSLLVPLEPGVHEYAFVVDGREWRPDPASPRVSDGFGGENSRLTVLRPDGRTL